MTSVGPSIRRTRLRLLGGSFLLPILFHCTTGWISRTRNVPYCALSRSLWAALCSKNTTLAAQVFCRNISYNKRPKRNVWTPYFYRILDVWMFFSRLVYITGYDRSSFTNAGKKDVICYIGWYLGDPDRCVVIAADRSWKVQWILRIPHIIGVPRSHQLGN